MELYWAYAARLYLEKGEDCPVFKNQSEKAKDAIRTYAKALMDGKEITVAHKKEPFWKKQKQFMRIKVVRNLKHKAFQKKQEKK